MPKDNATGTCKLTREQGKFVKAHILPLALTRLSVKGEKLLEGGLDRDGTPRRFIRRPTSWYDNRLVTEAGERILADIDTRAIAELRSLKLVWSGWGLEHRLQSDDIVAGGGQSYRRMQLSNAEALRLFFLSIAWRTAASSLAECSLVELSAQELEDIRQRVVARQAGPATDYPIQLFQLITRGDPHNRAPLLETQLVPKRDGSGTINIDCVRIYMDGLIAYVYLPHRISNPENAFFGFCVGVQDIAVVITHEFDESRTRANIQQMISATASPKHQPDLQPKVIAAALRSLFDGDPHAIRRKNEPNQT